MRKLINAKSSSIRQIASALLEYADVFSFVIRDGNAISEAASSLLEILRPYLLEQKKVSEWPGTRLLGERATLYVYHLNRETAHLLYTSEDELHKWLSPGLPEDLVFYKNNRPLFVSITHEKDAYFEVEEGEDGYLKEAHLI